MTLELGPVRLEPLTDAHVPALLAAAADPVVWRWLPAPQPRTVQDVAELVRAALDDPVRLAWAVVLDDRVVGSTSYLDVDVSLAALEIGWTWTHPEVWAGVTNPTCKLILLAHAFEDLGVERVLLKTDALNTRSREAIARLGARQDGVLRRHRLRPDGTARDTVLFSVLAAEWPQVRAGLRARLGLPPTGQA